MATDPVLIELEAEEGLATYADGLALQLGSDGLVFVPRPGIDPRARMAVDMPTAIVVRVDSVSGEAALANWLAHMVRQLPSGLISGKAEGRAQIFRASNREAAEALRFLIARQ